MWHSCSNYTLDDHFENVQPEVRATFDRFLEAVNACGPVTVIPQKTRIAIQAEVRFAGCVVRKQWLLVHLWLTRRTEHRLLQRVEAYGPRSFGHRFRLDEADDVDEALCILVREAYRVGLREHLRGP
ncbi:MAG: DUF5655 domain-containing protein [Gemmatimonadota bacterium]|nr:DUF5655 domain-containing protein [Gemmatimonadota bacterium]